MAWHQAIIWTNYRRIYALLGLNELMHLISRDGMHERDHVTAVH